ncbi:MAG: SOS response-associated peptidase [Candidatus Nanopelagicales bacterium]
MCGRYAASRSPDDLVEVFEVDKPSPTEPPVEVLNPDYNVAPTKKVYAVLSRPPRGDEVPDDAPPTRQLRVLKWGLVPSWAKDPAIGSRLINARMETVAEKPAFKRAFKSRRCLLPADGYYEWYASQAREADIAAAEAEAAATGKKPRKPKVQKQPFFIHPKDGSPMAMAGLYEFWRKRDAAEDDPDAWLSTCTVLTTTSEDAVGHIHDRMPLLVEPDRWGQWLDPDFSDPEQLTSLLMPAAPGRLDAYPVSTAVNNVRNNGPELLAPLPLDDLERWAPV